MEGGHEPQVGEPRDREQERVQMVASKVICLRPRLKSLFRQSTQDKFCNTVKNTITVSKIVKLIPHRQSVIASVAWL